MLKAVAVSKTFEGTEPFRVLDNISLSVKDGEFVCILGPSGCGKTILLYLLAGFIKPTHGEIFVDGKKLAGAGPDRMVVFQNYVLFPWKTVRENILCALDNTGFSSEHKEKLVEKYLSITGLSQFKDWYPFKLSGGMQQRVAVARALVTNPRIILMDEPFSALDAQYRKFLRNTTEKIWLKTKKSIVFVTHSVNEAICLADKIYLLSARPAGIKKVYRVGLPRPRDVRSKKFIELGEKIEKELSKEFERVFNDPSMEKSLEGILNVGGTASYYG